MKIVIAVPVRPGSTSGNSVTGERWQHQLAALGHAASVVSVGEDQPGGDGSVPHDADVLIALHARRCAGAVRAAVEERPERPVIVALTGTDLYQDLPDDRDAMRSLHLAAHLIVLQEHGLEHVASLDPSFASKASVVHQSVENVAARSTDPAHLTVVVLAHLRDVKDPLLSALAARLLPASSRVRIEHAGAPHSDAWRVAAESEMQLNDRYRWHGPIDRDGARRLLATADVLACTSKLEGGANVVSEAIAHGVAVVGTDIGGNRGLLGDDHPGLVDVGDHQALTRVFHRLDTDRSVLEELTQRSVERRWMTDPLHERRQLGAVLDQL